MINKQPALRSDVHGRDEEPVYKVPAVVNALSYLREVALSSEDIFMQTVSSFTKSKQKEFEHLFPLWVSIQEDEMQETEKTLVEVFQRLDLKKKSIEERVGSPAYLRLVKKSLRNGTIAESNEKRMLIQNLLINAGIVSLSPDYALEMFINWIGTYSPSHFTVMRIISENPGITRHKIWLTFNKKIPSEDSAAADMYKLLISDLSTGHLIRQRREKEYFGAFVKIKRKKKMGTPEGTQIASAFDDEKEYILTELGKQFVRYTMK